MGNLCLSTSSSWQASCWQDFADDVTPHMEVGVGCLEEEGSLRNDAKQGPGMGWLEQPHAVMAANAACARCLGLLSMCMCVLAAVLLRSASRSAVRSS